METHGPHLDHILIGETRMNWALLNMSRAIRRDDEAVSEEAIAAEELLAQPETPEEREQMAELEALKFRRLQSAADNAATQEGTRGGAKGIRRLCGAPLQKARCARRRGARGPLNIQELEHPPVTATRLATFAPFLITSCQRRRKKGPPRRRKKGPLGGCELVPVVHGRDLWAHGVKRGHGGRFTRRLGLDAGGFD